MEFNSVLVNLQGILLSLENQLGSLKNIKFNDDNCQIATEAIKSFVDEKNEEIQRSIHFYLVLNTDFQPIQEYLHEDENIAHLLNTAPLLSPDLLVNIVRTCKLQLYAYEVISYCEAALSIQYFEALSTHTKGLTTQNLIHQAIEFASAIFLRIVRLDKGHETGGETSNRQYVISKFYNTLTNIFINLLPKVDEIFSNLPSKNTLIETIGYVTKNMISLVTKCLSSMNEPCPSQNWYPSPSSISFDYSSWGKSEDVVTLNAFDFIVYECHKTMKAITIGLWLEWEEIHGENNPKKSLQTEIAEECYFCVKKESQISTEALTKLKTILHEYMKKPFDETDEIDAADLSTILTSINDKNKTRSIWMEALFKRDDGLSTLDALMTVKSNLDLVTTDLTALLMNKAAVSKNSPEDALLKQIAFEAFQKAPIIDQPKLLEDFFNKTDLNDCFKSKDFDSTLTSVLNRSPTLHTRRDKWLPELLSLCLQSPCCLLERMIMAGVASRGQGNQMCAALLELKPICELKVTEDTTLLLDALEQAMTTIDPATSQITHLVLQLEEKGLLNKVVFLKSCVLPALKRDLADYKVPHIQLWLQLLRRLLKVDSPQLIRVEEGLSLAVILAVLAEVLQRTSWILGKFRQQESLLRADTVLLVRPLACRMANVSESDDKELLWLRAGLLMLTSHNRSHFSPLWTHFDLPVPSMNLGALLLSRDAMCQQSSMPPGGPDQLLSPLLILLPTCCTPEWRLLASSLSSLLAYHHSAAAEEEEVEGTRTDEQMLPEVLRLLVTTLMLQALMLSQQQPDDAAFSNDCALACLENSVRNLGIVMKEEWLPRLSGVSVVEAGANVVRQVALLLRSLPISLASSCSLALSGVLVQAQEILLVQAAPQPDLATWCAHELALSLALLPDRESRQALSRKLLLEPALAQL